MHYICPFSVGHCPRFTFSDDVHAAVAFAVDVSLWHFKQGVAITGRITTGPPCSVAVEL